MNEILIAVNLLINQSNQYRTEQIDTWLTPTEFRQQGYGDCEDFAIAKYFKLRKAGIPANQLHLTYIKVNGQGHMVLVVNGMILDNRTNTIVPFNKTDTFNFNENVVRKGNKVIGNARQIKKWRGVLDRYEGM